MTTRNTASSRSASRALRRAIATLLGIGAFTATLGFVSAGAFGGGDNDPIIAVYEGHAYFKAHITVDGIDGGFVDEPHDEVMLLSFIDGNAAFTKIAADPDYTGSWKRKHSRYGADFSDSARDRLVLVTADAAAKASFKLKKIAIVGDGVGGQYRMTRTSRPSVVRIREKYKGVFGCLATGM